ncbi:MAG: hypothetical protein ACUVV0_04920 [Anaerolineae bacterium]
MKTLCCKALKLILVSFLLISPSFPTEATSPPPPVNGGDQKPEDGRLPLSIPPEILRRIEPALLKEIAKLADGKTIPFIVYLKEEANLVDSGAWYGSEIVYFRQALEDLNYLYAPSRKGLAYL